MGKVLVIGNADFSDVAVKKVDFLQGCYIKLTASHEYAKDLVTGNGFYAIGDTATIKAESNTLCQFVKWSDGNTNATREIAITEAKNLYLVAEYEINSNDNDFSWGNGGITTVKNTTGFFNNSASTKNTFIHTISNVILSINSKYLKDYIFAAYGISDVDLEKGLSWSESGKYYNIKTDNAKTLLIPEGKYVQINIANVKKVSFTSDLSLLAELVQVTGNYELV